VFADWASVIVKSANRRCERRMTNSSLCSSARNV
jgi:hypothetical protein